MSRLPTNKSAAEKNATAAGQSHYHSAAYLERAQGYKTVVGRLMRSWRARRSVVQRVAGRRSDAFDATATTGGRQGRRRLLPERTIIPQIQAVVAALSQRGDSIKLANAKAQARARQTAEVQETVPAGRWGR
jgi:hypothetical protein